MIRRTQLLEPESRSSRSLQLAAIADRLRDGLLGDNKVVPAVLGGVALLIFAWLIAGAFVGGADVQEEQQASNQASLAQDSKSGGTETPAPDVENPDTESYSEFGDPEDPFYPSSDIEDLFSKSGGGNNTGRNGDGNGGGNGGTRGDNGGDGDRDADRDDEGGDFIEQDSPPREPQDPDDSPSRGGEPDSGPGGDPGQGGSGDLFNSGGDLPAP